MLSIKPYNQSTNFLIACAGMLLFGITLITLGAILPDLKLKFGLDDLGAGGLFALLPFGILAGSIFFGPFCDRFGYKSMLVFSSMLIGGGLVSIAGLQNLDVLKAAVFVFGFGGGCLNGATNALVADISDKNKGANLSLLGVFFAIGALGMPFILAAFKGRAGFEIILIATALFAFVIGLVMLFVQFPPAKNTNSVDARKIMSLMRNPVLLTIAFFLFFQSSLEAIVHNWITSYLITGLKIDESAALYALTLNVTGMAVMRLITGSLLRNIADNKMLLVSMVMLLISSTLLYFANSYSLVILALTLLGAGLAAGFPMMYSIVGKRHPDISATAFSFILTIALIGNMLINYLMGILAKEVGVEKVTIVIMGEAVVMTILCIAVLKMQKKNPVISKSKNL